MTETGGGKTWSEQLDYIEKDCADKGWDSYDAEPVGKVAIDVARSVCDSMFVVPLNKGQLEINLGLKPGDETFTLTVYPDGKVALTYVDFA